MVLAAISHRVQYKIRIVIRRGERKGLRGGGKAGSGGGWHGRQGKERPRVGRVCSPSERRKNARKMSRKKVLAESPAESKHMVAKKTERKKTMGKKGLKSAEGLESSRGTKEHPQTSKLRRSERRERDKGESNPCKGHEPGRGKDTRRIKDQTLEILREKRKATRREGGCHEEAVMRKLNIRDYRGKGNSGGLSRSRGEHRGINKKPRGGPRNRRQ